MSELTPFQLSRVYATGWSAGMAHPLDAAAAAVLASGETLNPHPTGAARTRWMQGFSDAVKRRLDGPKKR